VLGALWAAATCITPSPVRALDLRLAIGPHDARELRERVWDWSTRNLLERKAE
jgi:hypothetical protein